MDDVCTFSLRVSARCERKCSHSKRCSITHSLASRIGLFRVASSVSRMVRLGCFRWDEMLRNRRGKCDFLVYCRSNIINCFGWGRRSHLSRVLTLTTSASVMEAKIHPTATGWQVENIFSHLSLRLASDASQSPDNSRQID